MNEIKIRSATVNDAERLLEIYAPYVRTTAITFEYTVPDVQDFRGRIARTLEKYPYFVAVVEGKIVGYAYLSAFHARKAYQWSAETSIYLEKSERGKGIGRALYEALENAAGLMNIINLNACIASPIVPDETLTDASIRFHDRMGYRMVGTFNKCGYKFDRWYNMCWMEKHIGAHVQDPGDIRSFPEVKAEFERKYSC